jgi:acetylornithine deacetylase
MSELDPVALLRRLVSLDTTSARSNLLLVDLLEAELRTLGFSTQRQEWHDEAGIPKANLVAERAGSAAGQPGLALVGHTDCVPFDAAWGGALKGAVEDGKLFGRGAADTKGFIAAALAACAQTRAHRLPLLLVFTADEEVGCLGAKRLLADSSPLARRRPLRAIVGEPTRLIPVLGHKGYCHAEIEIEGAEGHSAFPETGASAILAAGRLLRELEALAARLESDADPLFAPPHTTLNVGLISGGKARNVIAGACRMTLEWRPIPGQDVRRVLGEVEKLCAAASVGRIRAQVKPARLDAGVAVAPGDLIRFLEGETGNRAASIPFGTELPQLAALGAEACVFGPGDIRVAHRTGEFIPLNELNHATGILARAVARFCA